MAAGKSRGVVGDLFSRGDRRSLPVVYPFIISNPGEAAQAKRRIAAVTIGHLPPPTIGQGLFGDARELERLVDEYSQADGLDRRRRDRLAQLIVETARRSGLAREAGVEMDVVSGRSSAPDRCLALRPERPRCQGRTAHLWPFATSRPSTIRHGQRAWTTNVHERVRRAGWPARYAPGPAGSPHRERLDVLPTGRNMFAADPRTLPTPTAMELGRLAADEIIRGYLQAHGEMPRSLVIDLWGSATLRSGGEEIAQGLSLMGCRPTWDHGTGRVVGIEVLSCAVTGRPRVDVTWRISGLFRDLFPAQLALLDAAAKSVAALDESDDDNPLAKTRRSKAPLRCCWRAFSVPGRACTVPVPKVCSERKRDAMSLAWPISKRPRTATAVSMATAHCTGCLCVSCCERRSARALQQRSGARPARGSGGCRVRRGVRCGRCDARATAGSHHAGHDRSASSARPPAGCGAGENCAGARNQSPVHRRSDASRPARRSGARRDSRSSRRFRREHRRSVERVVRPDPRNLSLRRTRARLSPA